jgi:hypothetical protein
MTADLGIRAAVRAAIAHGNDHWTTWLEDAGMRFPQWYLSPQAALVPPITADAMDFLRMRNAIRDGNTMSMLARATDL